MQEKTQENWMKQVETIVETAAQTAGCVLYDLDFIGTGKGRTLRVFIDKLDGQVGIEECSLVSEQINTLLDQDENLIPGGAYNLEVSTPGVDRHLSKSWHFERVIGKKIWVKAAKAFEAFGVEDKKWKAAKNIEAELESFENDVLLFKPKGVEVRIPFSGIEKAHVVFDMNKGQKK